MVFFVAARFFAVVIRKKVKILSKSLEKHSQTLFQTRHEKLFAIFPRSGPLAVKKKKLRCSRRSKKYRSGSPEGIFI